MDYYFPHYLLSKQTVDDRALNRSVYEALQANLPVGPLRIVEVGAGIGTMPARLLRWGLLQQAEYVAVDQSAENVSHALEWIPAWAGQNGMRAESEGENRLKLFDGRREVRLVFVAADAFTYARSVRIPSDLLIAHAFLDLVPLPAFLGPLFSLLKPGGLGWLTLNFDGVTSLVPAVDARLDAEIERLYHRTMDERPEGGDSRTGRHLFDHLRTSGADLLAAGPSDWVVHPTAGRYPAEEAFFLDFILHFFEQSLGENPELEVGVLASWLAARREQLRRGELVYIAHQLDFLVRV